MHGVGSLDGVPQSRIHIEMVVHADAPEDQHPILFLDFTDDLSPQVVPFEFDLARCQRAGKGARESAASRRHEVVERGRAFSELRQIGPVVLRNGPMHAELDQPVLGRQLRDAVRTAFAVNGHV